MFQRFFPRGHQSSSTQAEEAEWQLISDSFNCPDEKQQHGVRDHRVPACGNTKMFSRCVSMLLSKLDNYHSAAAEADRNVCTTAGLISKPRTAESSRKLQEPPTTPPLSGLSIFVVFSRNFLSGLLRYFRLNMDPLLQKERKETAC